MNYEKYMAQAGLTADAYMQAACFHIDAYFGEGYAEKNPELVGQFMRTAAADFAAMAKPSIEDIAQETAQKLQEARHYINAAYGASHGEGYADRNPALVAAFLGMMS